MYKDEYYQLIKEKGINDIFSYIEELPYSKKIQIIKELLNKYKSDTLNMALNDYYINYILIRRVDLSSIVGILKGLCKRNKRIEYINSREKI